MGKPRIQHVMTHQEYEAAVRERFVALFPEPEFVVIGGPKCHWPGRMSVVDRQVDVAVLRKGSPDELFMVADAKRHGDRLDVVSVEAFLGFLDDVGCRRGVLASLLGGSPGASRRAAGAGVDLHVVSYEEALAFDWPRVAAGLYPWDIEFHPVLANALRLIHRGRVGEALEEIEVLPFEEWTALFTVAPANVRTTAERVLRAIAEVHSDDAWRFNALQILDDEYGAPPTGWLEERLRHEEDAETRELIAGMLSRG